MHLHLKPKFLNFAVRPNRKILIVKVALPKLLGRGRDIYFLLLFFSLSDIKFINYCLKNSHYHTHTSVH